MSEGIEEVATEKMLPQSAVNKLVVGIKREAQEKSQLEAERYKQEIEQLKEQQQVAAPPETMGMGGVQVDPNKIREDAEEGAYNRVRDELQKERESYDNDQRRQNAEKFVTEYEAKLEDGRQNYEDFDKVIAKIKPDKFTALIIAAKNMDGTSDIMYELAKNPSKLALIDSMLVKSPEIAQEMLSEISSSIKMNRDALDNVDQTNKPLNKLKPSTAGTNSSSSYKSVRDFKSAPYLRG